MESYVSVFETLFWAMCAAGSVVFTALAVFCHETHRRSPRTNNNWNDGAFVCWICAAVLLVVATVGGWPFLAPLAVGYVLLVAVGCVGYCWWAQR